MSENERRKREAAERFNAANANRIVASFQDKVKLAIVEWMMANKHWTVQDLKREIRQLEQTYGLTNRYLPPNFKRENVSEPNTTGTEGTT